MPLHRFGLVALCGLLPALTATPTFAQRSQVSLQLTFGVSTGQGGDLEGDRSGTALDGLLSWRTVSRRALTFVWGAGAGFEGPNSKASGCIKVVDPNCVPELPRIYSLGLFAGLEHQGKLGDVRFMMGPTNYRASGGGSNLGVQGRLELASPPVHHVSLIGSARGGLVWNLDQQDLRLGAIGLGFAYRM